MAASLARSVSGMLIYIQNAPAGYQLLDIGVGGAGSEQVVVPNIMASEGLSGTHANKALYIPVSIPAGSRVALRSQSSQISGFMTCKCQFLADEYIGVQPPERWIDWGTNLAGSNGTSFTTGNATKGAWTQLVAASDFTTKWLMIEIEENTAPVDIAIDIGVGAAAAEQVIIPNLHFTAENLGLTFGPFPFTIPGGSRISVRGQAAGGTCLAILHGGA